MVNPEVVFYLLRLKDLTGNYKTILHQSRAINVSDDGKIQQVLTVHSDVTFLDIPFNHKISFISQNKPNYYTIEKDGKYIFEEKSNKKMFTKREVEIIKKIAEGKIYSQIADELFVAKNTINFHRKNILRKSGYNNSAQLIAQCVEEGII
jgi:DNA-binding NarL/FixJ family response regulator